MAGPRGTCFAVAPSGPVGENISTSEIPVSSSKSTPSTGEQAKVSAGHLSVGLTDRSDVRFSFERQPKRMGGAFAASFISQAAIIALAFIGFGTGAVQDLITNVPSEIVWLAEPGPGGGGGGGGNQMKEPPRAAELPGKDKITVPTVKPPAEEPKPKAPEPDPVEQLTIPAATLASAAASLPGALEAPPGPPSPSLGSGTGGGSGTGAGTGIGPGTGSGLGPGSGGNTGGGPMRPGSGISTPVRVREVKPAYTSDAMRAKIQGVVLLRAIVNRDGTVGDVEVIRSLDSTFGLDQEAIKAAKQWLFRPSIRTATGEPVPVEITIELTFTLR
jgi:protein TonB